MYVCVCVCVHIYICIIHLSLIYSFIYMYVNLLYTQARAIYTPYVYICTGSKVLCTPK